MIKQSLNCSVSVKISKFPKAVKVLVTSAAEQSLIRYQQQSERIWLVTKNCCFNTVSTYSKDLKYTI